MTVSAVAAASSSRRVMIISFFMASPFDVSFIPLHKMNVLALLSADNHHRRPDDSLFRRFTVEVFVVGFRFGAGMVDNAVPMIRGRIDRIELHWNSAGIDDVVIRPTRDNNSEACLNCCPNAIDNRFTGTLLHAKKLVGLMGFRPDFTLGI